MEADGTVDAPNAPTAPWKTLRVFHELPQGLSHRITHAKPRKAQKWRWETRIDPNRPSSACEPEATRRRGMSRPLLKLSGGSGDILHTSSVCQWRAPAAFDFDSRAILAYPRTKALVLWTMASPSVSASTHGHAARGQAWQTGEAAFDVAIVGAGVGGAAVFRELSRRGYSVLLVDQGDFAGGPASRLACSSGGGLLYLQSLDIATVRSLSLAREALLEAQSEDVAVASFRYLSLRAGGRPAWHVRAALEAYWWLGGRRRRRPRRERDFATRALLTPRTTRSSPPCWRGADSAPADHPAAVARARAGRWSEPVMLSAPPAHLFGAHGVRHNDRRVVRRFRLELVNYLGNVVAARGT